MNRKVYVAGKITGLENHKELFQAAEDIFIEKGDVVMNPAKLNPGFTQEDYLHICFAMLDCCDTVYFLNNWKDSKGAKAEMEASIFVGHKLLFQDKRDASLSEKELIKILEEGKNE